MARLTIFFKNNSYFYHSIEAPLSYTLHNSQFLCWQCIGLNHYHSTVLFPHATQLLGTLQRKVGLHVFFKGKNTFEVYTESMK